MKTWFFFIGKETPSTVSHIWRLYCGSIFAKQKYFHTGCLINVAYFLICCVFPHLHFFSLLQKLQSKCPLLSPPNPKAPQLCHTASQGSTREPSLKPSPTTSSPRVHRAAALSYPLRARLSPSPQSRTPHLRQQYAPSLQNYPLPKTPAWVSHRP